MRQRSTAGTLLALAALAASASSCAVRHQPRAALGYGELAYSEHDSTLRRGLESSFREPVVWSRAGWEFLGPEAAGHVDLEYLATEGGKETWDELGRRFQENALDLWRLGLEAGASAGTWDRTRPPGGLSGTSRLLRFSAGGDVYYRHQQFERDRFVPANVLLESSTETFDMAGVELVLDLEVGPREVLALFIRARGGGGYVGVENDVENEVAGDALERLFEEARVETAGVQGTVEAGLVSQCLDSVELRLGYRYQRMDVFRQAVAVSSGNDSAIVELPGNTTEMHLAFVEAAIRF